MVDAEGNVHAIWVEFYSSSTGDVFYARSNSGSQDWSTPLNLSNSSNVYCETLMCCGIDRDASGRVYAVWVEGNVIKLRILTGGSWGSTIQVASNSSALDGPRIAASPEGNIYLTWWSSVGTVYSRARVSGNWEESRIVSQEGQRSKFPDIACGNNIVYCCWVQKEGDIYQVAYAQRGRGYNSSWSSSRKVYSMSMSHQHPVVEINPSDIAHIVWTSQPDEQNRIVHHSYWTGSSFSSPRAISSTSMLHYPSACKDSYNLHACWQVGAYGGGQAIYFNSYANGTWSNESAIPQSGGSTFSDIAATPQGKLNAVWDGGGEIYFYNFSGTAPPPNEPPVAEFTFYPSTGIAPLEVTFDASASYDPDGEIVQYDWVFGDGTTGSGKVVPHVFEHKGTYSVKLTVIDDRGKPGSKVKDIEVLSLVPPLNIHWETFVDQSLFQSRFITEVHWEKNPRNDEIALIVLYRIYRKKTQESSAHYEFIGDVNAETFLFKDVNVKNKDMYDYTVTAVDNAGHESPIEETSAVGKSLSEKDLDIQRGIIRK